MKPGLIVPVILTLAAHAAAQVSEDILSLGTLSFDCVIKVVNNAYDGTGPLYNTALPFPSDAQEGGKVDLYTIPQRAISRL